jgi:hypothetical protein
VTEVVKSSLATIGLIDGVAYVWRAPEPWPPIPDPAVEVLAVPLDHPDKQKVVYRLPYKTVLPNFKPGNRLMVPTANLFFVADDTLRAWDSTRWARVDLKK